MKSLFDRYPKPLVVGVLMVSGTVTAFFLVLALGLLTEPTRSNDRADCQVGFRGGFIGYERCKEAVEAERGRSSENPEP